MAQSRARRASRRSGRQAPSLRRFVESGGSGARRRPAVSDSADRDAGELPLLGAPNAVTGMEELIAFVCSHCGNSLRWNRPRFSTPRAHPDRASRWSFGRRPYLLCNIRMGSQGRIATVWTHPVLGWPVVDPLCKSPYGFTPHALEHLLTPAEKHHTHPAQLGRRTVARMEIRALRRH